MEHVNHPRHYNARKDGMECIDIIRHYTCDIANALKYLWRAGLKTDAGITDREKEIEDLKKAVWYINDQLYLGIDLDEFSGMSREDFDGMQEKIRSLTGRTPDEIASPEYYEEHVARSMFYLLQVGLIGDGYVYRIRTAVQLLHRAIREIEIRIKQMEHED